MRKWRDEASTLVSTWFCLLALPLVSYQPLGSFRFRASSAIAAHVHGSTVKPAPAPAPAAKLDKEQKQAQKEQCTSRAGKDVSLAAVADS